MTLNTSLAQEIHHYIKNVLNRDVIIINQTGKVMSQDAPVESLAVAKDQWSEQSFNLLVNEKKYVVVPLKSDGDTVGGVVVPNDKDDADSVATIVKSFSELLVQQYLSVNKPVLDSTDQFISKLVHHATPTDLPLMNSEAQVLGYNFDVPRVAIVVHLHDFWTNCLASFDQASFEREDVIRDWKRSIEQKLANFFTKSTDNIIAYIGQDRFVVFKSLEGSDESTIVGLLKKSHRSIFEPLKNISISQLAVGVSGQHVGLQGMIDAYREASLALDFGTRMWGENKSYYFGDLGILSILGEGNREKEMQFANQLLAKLTNPDLIETLECFFDENLNLTETAERMGIHRNTVIYRLNQIATILGADPRVFEQAITIKIALLVKKLFG